MNGLWTVRRAAAAIGVGITDERPLVGVSTDTRQIAAGDLFVALRGERFDGHAFLAQAVAAGAAAVVVEDARAARGLGVPVLIVDDTRGALGALGRYARTAWARPVVAVGGSNGKTTTKDLLRGALSARLGVHATAGNHNNQIGVPQTLLSLHEGADVAVVEVGTNEPGEIALLRDIVLADIAVVTTVQEEHLEGFGTLAGVMEEEMSLCDGVALAVVPSAEPAVVGEARRRARAVLTAGLDGGDVTPARWTIDADGHGALDLGGARSRLPVPGVHNLANAMLAVAVARTLGVGDEDIARGLEAAVVAPMRSAVRPLGAALLVNDAYNANPGSVRAALALLSAVAGTRPQVAIVGTMRELGDRAGELHDEVARDIVRSGVALIGAVGEFAAAFARIAPGDPRVVGAPDATSIWPVLSPRMPGGAAVLLKGSRGVRLEQLVPDIEAWAGVARGRIQPS